MKKLVTLPMILLLTACGVSTDEADDSLRYQKICLNGVTYYERDGYKKGYLAVAFDKDGKVILCEK